MRIEQQITLAVIAGGGIFAAFRLFRSPMRRLLKLLVNTVLGFAALLIFNAIGAPFGMGLGLNLINALIVGILGLPGFALLLLVQMLFT
jgi:inhibitor of the pro-sigma K processing machinery